MLSLDVEVLLFALSFVESDVDSHSQTLLESDVDPLVVGILLFI